MQAMAIQSSPDHIPGGQRVYTAARWVILLTLFALTNIVVGRQPWDIPPGAPLENPLLVILLAYAGFTLAMTLALTLPFMARVFTIAPLIDTIFLALLSMFSGQQGVIFFPVYLFPLVSMALRQQPGQAFLSGLIAALLFAGAVLGNSFVIGDVGSEPNYVTLGLMGLVLVFVPLLISSQIGDWSSSNQAMVKAAKEQVQQANQQATQARDEAQAAYDEVRLLYEIATGFATRPDSTPDLKQIFTTLLNGCKHLVPYSTALVLKKTDHESGNELHVEAGQAMHPGDPGKTFLVSNEGKLAELLTAGAEAVLLRDVGQHADIRELMSLHTCKAAWIIPLQFGVPIYGMMLIGSDQTNVLTEDQREPLTIMAKFASVALRNDALMAELQPYRERRVKSDKQAREELTRFIHDGLAQTSAQIVMKIDMLKRIIAADPPAALEEVNELYQKVRHYHYYEVREVLTALTPLPLGQGLYTVLNQLVDRKRESYKETHIILDVESIKQLSLHYDTENMFFNIAQESLNNALKYAEAQHIWVRCKTDGTHLSMTIQDDGKGFDVEKSKEAARKRGSFGLFNISDRARLIGGEAQVLSKIGKGSFVRVIAPVHHPAHSNGQSDVSV